MTPTQLRAFACVVRLGSVKAAAKELSVSEAAVSMHVGQLRKELDDILFKRTASGLAFTPGGLRLASRAVEILGLQDRTVMEVSQAGRGRRVLRVATSSLFAEHAAPGLLQLFAARDEDLEVELSVRPVAQFAPLLAARTVDVAIGPTTSPPTASLVQLEILLYEILAVVRTDHPFAGTTLDAEGVRHQSWCVGPSAVENEGVVPAMLRRLGVPEQHQQVFQSQAAALEEAHRSNAVALAVRFAVAGDLAAGRLVKLRGPGLHSQGRWVAMALPARDQTPAATDLLHFITTPRATQAMVRGAGAHRGRFTSTAHVTVWN